MSKYIIFKADKRDETFDRWEEMLLKRKFLKPTRSLNSNSRSKITFASSNAIAFPFAIAKSRINYQFPKVLRPDSVCLRIISNFCQSSFSMTSINPSKCWR